jgi:hypothetical protein
VVHQAFHIQYLRKISNMWLSPCRAAENPVEDQDRYDADHEPVPGDGAEGGGEFRHAAGGRSAVTVPARRESPITRPSSKVKVPPTKAAVSPAATCPERV